MPPLVYVLLIAHFVGDFVCQTDWMALNKSKRWDALTHHVAAYSAVLMISVGWWTNEGPRTFGLWVLVNAAAHFVQDAITSRINARLWFIDLYPDSGSKTINLSTGEHFWWNYLAAVHGERRHWFFVGIGADQLLHYVTLLATAEWWLR